MSILDDLKMEYRMGGVVQRLMFWNIGLFLLPLIVFSLLSFKFNMGHLDWRSGYNDWFSLSAQPADLLWKPWSLFGYAFLHAGPMHLLFNMLMLYFAGRVFLTFFTQKQLFGLYILSAMFAGFIFMVSYTFVFGQWAKMVGASAAIMAILVAAATYAPYYQVRLLLIGTVKLWHIAIVFIALDLIYASAENTGGHIAHLAGSLFGFLYIRLLQNGTDLSKGVSAILNGVANIFKPKKSTPFKKVHRNPVQSSKKSTAKPKDITQQQIDDILDKISKSGYDSLTKEEKEFLFKVGK
ncbi:MAG TPA: rhomboid family intramembrane serine protease [Flavobacterium sp.]|nr:rhomboid family intramembrane serine protease [Flavobacterium sp.]